MSERAQASARSAAPASPRGVADIALAGLVVAIVATMILPLPLGLLDVLLACNMALAIVLLLVALYVPDALGIASFPTILLVTTLYRLALDVAATRNILGRGDGGEVIRAFGQFVVRGNYVVGGVVFVILTLVQFLVIAKGSERVAEVAARFTLDAMPGKQMAIDAELRAGAIDQAEARRRRRGLARESSFYGAMDGAMKFVKGDAIAGIVITFVNILGGLAIGVGQRGMSAGDALRRFGLLTIGEGLVAQIPALIVSTAAGILVTRVASEEPDQSLGAEISRQLVAQPRALGIAAVLLLLFGLTPGMPAAPFLTLAAALGVGARALAQAQRRRARQSDVLGTQAPTPTGAAPAAEKDPQAFKPGAVPIELYVGDELLPLARSDGREEAPLRSLISTLREELFRELGVQFPGVRVRQAGPTLAPDEFEVHVYEVPVASHRVPAGRVFVREPGAALAARGIGATDPSSNARGTWVEAKEAAELGEEKGSPPELFIALALGAALRGCAARFVGIHETQQLLDGLEGTHGALVRHLVPKPLAVPLLAEILRRLVEEGVSIRNLRDILEGLAPYCAQEKDPVALTELARQALRRQLSWQVAPGGTVQAWLLAPEVTEAIREAIVRTAAGSFLRLDPRLAEELRTVAMERIGDEDAVLLTEPDLRRFVWLLFEARLKRLRVLSHAELESTVAVEMAGQLG